jgi:hypothetical protein
MPVNEIIKAAYPQRSIPMKTTVKSVPQSLRFFASLALAAIIGFYFASCDNGTTTPLPDNLDPVAGDFTIKGTGTFTYDGGAKTVTVTAKEGKTSGAVTVKYGGKETAPSAEGAYTVTFDVEAAPGWNEAARSSFLWAREAPSCGLEKPLLVA